MLATHPPWKAPGRNRFARAAVAVVLKNAGHEDWEDTAEILFVRRAKRRGDPWSGHTAFPGGRRENGDAAILDTAVRETAEETGLDLKAHGVPLGRLSDVLTRTHERFAPMVVTPYVFGLQDQETPQGQAMRTNHELVETCWTPFRFLADPANRRQMRHRSSGLDWKMPCYDYKGVIIWGLSLLILDDFLGLWRGRPKGFFARTIANRPALARKSDKDLILFKA